MMAKLKVMRENNDRDREISLFPENIHSNKRRRPLNSSLSCSEESAFYRSLPDELRKRHDYIGIEGSEENSHVRIPTVLDSELEICSEDDSISCNLGDNMIRLEEGCKEHSFLKHRFLLGMGSFGQSTIVDTIYKNSHGGLLQKARLQAFQVYSNATMKKCQGNANIKLAWYGTQKEKIRSIIDHGFGLCNGPNDGGLYGYGLYLSPESSSINSALFSPVDKNGLRHVLLCRVLMGNMEEICPGTKQFHPTEGYDSGVDDKLTPKTYIIWPTHVNTHVLPEYVVSFRFHLSDGRD